MHLTKLAFLCVSVVLLPALGQAYEVIEVPDGGVVQGTVKIIGTLPAPRKLLITKDPEVCGTGERILEEVSVSEGGGLRNVVVYLEGIEQGKGWENVPEEATLDQRGCRFLPSIAIVPKGKKMAITNSDPVLHNIHTYEVIGRVRRTLFNVAQPLQGTIKKSIDVRSTPIVKAECDLHNFMEGWIFVAETPYVTLVTDGQFSLEGIPPGSYVLKAWHPVLGIHEATAEVQAGSVSTVTLEFSTP